MTPHLSWPDELSRDLQIANRSLAHEGVLDGFGHISVRHPRDAGLFLMARAVAPALMTPADIQVFDLAGTRVGGLDAPSYGERFIHAAVFEARSDVQAVCHSHSPSVIPFSVTGQPLVPIMHMAALQGTEVRVWDIADEFGETDLLVRNQDKGRSLARALGSRRALLMRGHGAVVTANDVRELVMSAIYMELNARLLAQALAFGRPVRALSEREAELVGQTNLQPANLGRAWDYWAARAELLGT